jgi:serine protease Do
LIPGDFVTGIGTEDVTDILDLRRIVGLLEPGEARQFQVIRFGEEIRVEVRIGELTETARERDAEALWPGFYVFGLTQRIRSRLPNASGLNGVVVANVISGSRADRAGFTAGDVITRIDNRAVGTVEDFYRALDDGSGPRRFRVRRRGTTILLDMRK